MEVEIRAAHERMRETYGPERLQADLADNGVEVAFTGSSECARSSGCAASRSVPAKRLGKRLIHHSGRGSQYCAHANQKLLQQFGMQAAMSHKGNCRDNAPMESCRGFLGPQQAPRITKNDAAFAKQLVRKP